MNDESSPDLDLVATAISNAISMINQQQASVNLAITSFKQLQNKFITFQNRKRKRKKRSQINRFSICENNGVIDDLNK